MMASPLAQTPRPAGARILMVDDRADKLLALESILTDLGPELVRATSGKEALRLLLAEDFAVILLDVNMPVMDGFETAKLIRTRDRSRHTPIIFISAINSSETHAARGYELGAVDYIFAPVMPEVLRAKVSVFIELHRKTEQLAQSEALMRSVFDESAVGMALLDEDGRIQQVNRAFCRLVARSPLECLACDEPSLTHANDRGRVERALRDAEPDQPVAQDKRYLRPDGSEVWASVTTLKLSGEGGRGHRLVMAMDISERRHIRELETMTDELQRSNADLEQFAYIASHDLQEPLRMVSSYCSLLAARYRDRFDERGQQYLDHAVQGALRMHGLIHDLLGFSRAGKREPARITCDTGAILNQSLEDLREAIREANAEIVRGDLPTIAADPVLLGQLFQNLIGNALKFRPTDRATRAQVRIDARRIASGAGAMADGDEAGWEFSIADNGIGIDPDHHQRIFGVFQRLHTREQYPGTGIGLALCRKVAERHGGRIWVDSQVGAGATFRFTIPERPVAQVVETRDDVDPAASSAAG